MTSLDDVERAAYAAAVLVGDRAVEADLAVPTVRVPGRPVDPPEQDAIAAVTPSLLLDGEWLIAGSNPQKQFSIERWAEPPASRP
ncbi:hypothetical protein, partial [Clavibacter michiganensis]|uniref:hypothetical protein n=1 Tax=Clavibacter michiganensis TaxID=28447 RepID=UPI002931D7D2